MTFVQTLESPIQQIWKLGVQKFWEEEQADGRHAILLYGDSVRWTACAKPLPDYHQ